MPMRSKVILIVLIALAFGALTVVNNKYQEVRERRQAESAAVVVKSETDRKIMEDKLGQTVSERDYYQKQCQVGLNAYVELTKTLAPAAKAKLPAPDCELSFQ